MLSRHPTSLAKLARLVRGVGGFDEALIFLFRQTVAAAGDLLELTPVTDVNMSACRLDGVQALENMKRWHQAP